MTSCRSLLGLGIAAMSVGCASGPDLEGLSGTQRSKFEAMEVFHGPAPRPHTVIQPVKNSVCLKAYQQESMHEDETLQGLKLKAARLDADAISNAACLKRSGAEWNDCWSSIVCAGDAIRYKQ